MKKYILALLTILMVSATTFAQADKILGVYRAERDGKVSKIRISKLGNGYTASVIWVGELYEKDGKTVKTDKKNPDPKLRNVPVNKIKIIDKIVYNDGKWSGGKVYDPTRGQWFTVECSFKSDKILGVRGSWGIIHATSDWTKLE